jgi:hypothetical protein
VLSVSTLPANAQVEEYAGAEQGLPLEALPAASEPSPEVGYDPGEGPGLPEQPQPESDLTPDGLPLDSLATEAAPEEPPALPEEMLGVLGADPNVDSEAVEPNADSFAYPGLSFSHLSTAGNISAAVSYFDSPALNDLPTRTVFANVLLNPLGANTSYNNHPTGVYYSNTADQWSVFNEDTALMTAGVAFSAFKPAQNSVFFTHTATAGNISGSLTVIDKAYLNNNPDALVFAIPAYNPGGTGTSYHNHNVGMFYSPSTQRWGIYNEDTTAMTADSTFYVYYSLPAYDLAFEHTTTASSTIGNYTVLDHPQLNGNPNAVVTVIHNFPSGSGQYFNHVLGVWYSTSRQRWTIYMNESGTMPDGYHFNVLVQANRETSFVVHANAGNIKPEPNDHVVLIDHPLLNSNPNALVYAMHNWNPAGISTNVIDNHPLGVLYTGGRWAVYHTDFEPIPLGAAYNIFVTFPKANSYSVEVDDQNSTASTLHLNHSQLNDHAGAVFLATENFNPSELVFGHTYGYPTYAAYDSGGEVWNILRVGGLDYSADQSYNVFIPYKNGFTHTVSVANKPFAYVTCLNHPLTNSHPAAKVFAYVNGTPEGGGGHYLNIPIGVYYKTDSKQWCIYTEDVTFNIPLGTVFNVFVDQELLYLPMLKK